MSTIVLYWGNPRGFDAELRFSPFHELVFKSHQRVGNTVELWTHQYVEPNSFVRNYKNITIKDADAFIPRESALESLNNGHSIAHISDAVRLKRASQINGVVLDMDAVCLRPFPTDDSWFSTMPAKKAGVYAPKWGKDKPPMTVHDGSWDGKELTAFPIKVAPTTSQKISDLADTIMKKLAKPPKGSSDEWNSVLWTVKAIANEDTTAKILEPLYNCPVPTWLSEGNCYSMESPTRLTGNRDIFGHTLPSIDEILENSYCVQHFFESAWNNADVISDELWNSIPKGSLLYKECELILGEEFHKRNQGIFEFAATKEGQDV